MSRLGRRDQLVGVADRLFAQHGFAVVSMEDIARGADVSRPVVYEHFGSKEGAYLACAVRAKEEYEARLGRSVDLEAGPQEQLAAGADAFFAMLEELPGSWMMLFGAIGLPPGPTADELADLRFSISDGFREVLRVHAGEIDEWRLEACAHASSAIGERLGIWWLRHPEVSRAELVAQYVDITWSGLHAYFPTTG